MFQDSCNYSILRKPPLIRIVYKQALKPTLCLSSFTLPSSHFSVSLHYHSSDSSDSLNSDMDEVRQLFHRGKTPEDVFNDYKGRRAGILKALTTDADQFFQECDPEKGSLCLFGYSDESWRVTEPSNDVPTEVPEPTVGINYYRDRLLRKDWLAYVALHSDVWLLSLSFYLGNDCEFDKTSRMELFNLINDVPTIREMLTGGHSAQVERVFRNFKGRRAGILKALTTDLDKFFQECDPGRDNLCLYGRRNGSWKLVVPGTPNIREMPVPTLGINFARDGMLLKDWLRLIAVSSDAWLLSVSTYIGITRGLNKESRQKLFDLMNDLPTIYEIVNASNPVLQAPAPTQKNKEVVADVDIGEGAQEGEEAMEDDDTPCAACGGIGGGFWIYCNTCEFWFHGVCVNVTPEEAKHIKRYECPTCHNKRTAGQPRN